MRPLDAELCDAVFVGDETATATLLERGAQARAPGPDGATALHYAAADRRVAIARALIERGEADVNARDRQGHTPLHIAVMVARLPRGAEMVCLLLNAGADPSCRDATGETPLACARRHERLAGGAVAYLFDVN